MEEQSIVYEGMVAQALERCNIVSVRCELNRQIKENNALLRELKAEVEKLEGLVARTTSYIATQQEKLHSRVMLFCYQPAHIPADCSR